MAKKIGKKKTGDLRKILKTKEEEEFRQLIERVEQFVSIMKIFQMKSEYGCIT